MDLAQMLAVIYTNLYWSSALHLNLTAVIRAFIWNNQNFHFTLEQNLVLRYTTRYNPPSQITPEAGCHGNKINFFFFSFSINTKGENKQQKRSSSDMAPQPLGVFHYHPSAQQRLKESGGPSIAPTTDKKTCQTTYYRYRTKLHFILPLITLMEVPL